jgi:hypothetical protein
MGGDNKPSNLIYLEARAHFVAHWLLIKMYPKNTKLKFALNMMCNNTSVNNQRILPTYLYKIGRESLSLALSLDNPMFNPNTASKISGDNHYMKQEYWKTYFSENRKGKLNPMYGKENPSRCRSVTTPEGVFRSVTLSAKHFGVSTKKIRGKLNSENKLDWYYTDMFVA